MIYKMIKDFANVVTGGTPSTVKNEYWENGEIPWLNSGELNQGIVTNSKNYITKIGLDNSSARLMPIDTILIALTGATTGVIGYLTFEACANQSVTGILPSKNHFPKYLYYYLKSIRSKILSDSYGGAQPHISQAYVKNLQIPLPPLQEQKRIAAILDAADLHRQKTKELIAKYEELAQALFLDMFGDPVTNPMGWEKKSLSKLGKVTTGNTPPRNIPEYYGNFIEWIKTDNINTPNIFLTESKEGLSFSGIKFGRKVGPNSILVTCIAGSKRVLGNAAITNREVAFNQQINAFTPNILAPFFWYWQFKLCQKYVQEFSTGGMKGMISKSNFEKIEFIFPNKRIIDKFNIQASQIYMQMESVRISLQKAENLFQSLLQKAFKGEL